MSADPSNSDRDPALSGSGASASPTAAGTAAALDERWLAEGLERCRRGVRNYGLLAFAMIGLSAAYSWFFEAARFNALAYIRLGTLTGIVAVVWAARTSFGYRWSRQLGVLLMLIVAIGMNALAQETGGQLSPQYQRLFITIYGSAVLMTWSGWWGLLGCVGVVSSFVVVSAAAGQTNDLRFLGNLGSLTAASVFVVAIHIVRERLRWRELLHAQAATDARLSAEREIRELNVRLEQRVAERAEELHASERRMRAMFEAAPIGIVTVAESGRILEANGAFGDLIGEEWVSSSGASIFDLTAPQDRAATVQLYRELAAGRRSVFTTDKRYLRADGEEATAHEVVAAIRDDNGGFEHALAMVEDVSDRVRAEERVREHEGRLAHVLRVSALGEMATELAHEINQPLGAIVNFANGSVTRLRNADADPELIESVSRISSEARRASEILRRMHEFVQPRRLSREPTDVNALVNDVALLVTADARRAGVSLRLCCEPELPLIVADAIQIEQVIFNLVRNAIDAVRDLPTTEHELVIETSSEAGALLVSVQDTGPGVRSDARGRIFEAFYTTKPGGLGMGLSIARTIVEAHGGTISVEDREGSGMTIGFRLPLDDEIAAEA